MFAPKNIKKWTHPDHYFGAKWPEYYSSGVGQSRDSDALERSNFVCMLRELGGESDTVIVVRESHWAVGWVEWIAVHESDEKALETADDIKGRLEDYPVINDDHFSELEWTEAADYWNSLSPREKVQMALSERARYHWLQNQPVWMYGRMTYCDIPDDSIGQALQESLRNN